MSRGKTDAFDVIRQPGGAGPQVPPGLPWLAEAARMLDASHDPGLAEGTARLSLVSRIDRALPFDLPWCGAFAAHCLRAGLPGTRRPWFYMRARPWLRWGAPAQPQLGALLVFWLRWKGGPFGHVGFCWGEDDDHFHVLGGNQRDRIAVERFPKARLIGCRWPEGVPRPNLQRRAPPHAAALTEHAEPEEVEAAAAG
ncbi:TIGR02594 family protein [Albimonas donghaensis]|uniref:TIGR02594 family protein n=1 Tax=Albimonas donghaensis TaxID=356660 RepID=A0A1H3EYX9_9RHOB|nr:CHAP domain-containing protein [Albimonas donghaensis]SDX83951.1 TIGR02594 family protein [Albimonas donghaensis]